MSDLTAHDLAARIQSVITRPKLRDKQIKIGPSALGSDCAWCVATTMAMKFRGTPPPPSTFSMYPWIGTAVHFYLEHLMAEDPDFQFELEFEAPVGEIEGYGTIKGNIDMYSKAHQTVLDYKIVGKSSRNKYSRDGLSSQYFYQAQLYALGVENLGLPVRECCVLLIPRDSASPADIKPIVVPYDRAHGEAALRRASRIFNEYVVPNRIDELEQSPDCMNMHFKAKPVIKLPKGNINV